MTPRRSWWRRAPLRLWWGIGMVLGALILGTLGQAVNDQPPSIYEQWTEQTTTRTTEGVAP